MTVTAAAADTRDDDARDDDARDAALRLAGHLVETAWLADPTDSAIQRARHDVFAARADASTSTMARGVFTWAANEGGAGLEGGPAAHGR